jgi:predicted nucleic acid-binding protein
MKVVDASALAALLFNEPEARDIAVVLEGAELAAPALLPFEMASICLKKIRRDPGAKDDLVKAFQLLYRMDVSIEEIDLVGMIDLAGSSGLTTYDASYLWLARHLGAELVTLDRQLQAAARIH